MLTRSVSHLRFVKDDVFFLDMPARHTWIDGAATASLLLRRRRRGWTWLPDEFWLPDARHAILRRASHWRIHFVWQSER